MSEDFALVQVTVRVTKDQKKRFEQIAELTGMTQTAVLLDVINRGLAPAIPGRADGLLTLDQAIEKTA